MYFFFSVVLVAVLSMLCSLNTAVEFSNFFDDLVLLELPVAVLGIFDWVGQF